MFFFQRDLVFNIDLALLDGVGELVELFLINVDRVDVANGRLAYGERHPHDYTDEHRFADEFPISQCVIIVHIHGLFLIRRSIHHPAFQ